MNAAGSPTPDAEALIPLTLPLDLRRTLWPLAHGTGDPTIRFDPDGTIWRASRTAQGPVTIQVRAKPGAVRVRAWGPGATTAIADAAALIGLEDDPDAFVPRHPLLTELQARLPGLRLPRTGRILEALLPAILEQKVTGIEARRAYRGLIRRLSEPAPGPAGRWLSPTAARLAALPYFEFHRLGVERRRAEVIRRAAAEASRLEGRSSEATYARMRAIPGIGPWTLAEVGRVAFGDPDAVSVGDFHVPNLVAWALAGEPRADDARMLELLEPYCGQRGRVQRMLEASGLRVPRYGPRMTPHEFAEL